MSPADREPLVGKRLKRTEDPRLIRGLGHYDDDLRFADLLHVSIVRSPHAHARIIAVDARAARAAKDVVAVVTVEDLDAAKVGDVPCAVGADKKAPHPCLARGKVRFVGDPVAAVVATSAYGARDAADLVSVEYDPLEAVVDVERALAPGATLVHDELGTNRAFDWSVAGGDVEAAFRAADRTIAQPIVHQRLIPVAMEPRGAVAQYLPGEQQLTVWTSTQIPHLVKTLLAGMVGLPEHRVRIVAPEVGGGFGSKLNVYAEEGLVAVLAMMLAPRPVQWIETRRENFQGTIHGRDQRGTVELAFKNDGTLLGLKYKCYQDLGAYLQLLSPAIPTLTGSMITGAYKIPNVKVDVIGVYTNKMATDAYRGAGRPEATYTIERVVDLVAREVGKDPADVRWQNFPKPEEFPWKTATGNTYDSGNYQLSLRTALEKVGYSKLREEQREARGKDRLLGIGVSTYVEICALGPSSGMAAGGWESATVRVERTGKVTVLTGVSPHGQGQETTFAQLVADGLGVGIDDIVVIHGDTAQVPYGIGTFGSRAMAVGGAAVAGALERVREKARRLAAHILGAGDTPDTVSFEGGTFRGPSGKSMSFAEVAGAAYHAKSIPDGFEPGLSATATFEPKNCTFPFGCHVAVVEVDRETGDVKFLRYVAVDDCGKVVNPLLVDGQVHGGIVQALGQALFEECVYDEGGQLVTGTLMDYAVPKAHQCPRFETDRTETPTDANPLGVKGVGEAGTIGATPAIVNAVVDALAPFGVKHVDMPLRPEKLWRLMQQGGKA